MICNPLILLIMNYAFVFLRDLSVLRGKMSVLLEPIFVSSSAVVVPASYKILLESFFR